MSYGWMGNLLHVNLSDGSIKEVPLNERIKEDFVGGKGFGARLLYDMVPKAADAFSEHNALMFLTGPLTGTLAPAMRGCAVTKSPLTGTFVDSYFGGDFAHEIKFAGYDGIIITGRSPGPVYLSVTPKGIELKDARDLWGLDTLKTAARVREAVGAHHAPKVACIGPAGENKVRFALINCDPNRHAGRGGCGAVMGAKHLKAVVVAGNKGVRVKRGSGFMEAVNGALAEMKDNPYILAFRNDGTPGSVPFADLEGLLPSYNYRGGSFKQANKLDPAAQKSEFWLRDAACFSCPIGCSKVGMLKRGRHRGLVTDVVEYESAGMIGSNLGIGDTKAVAYLTYLCDALGMDSISAGGVVGFYLECAERGVWGNPDHRFGDPSLVERLLLEIAHRSSETGDLLAEGVKRASARIGRGTADWAVHVKGLETPAWGVRGAPGMGLAYMTGDRGGCHQRAFPILYEVGGEYWKSAPVKRLEIEGKAEIVSELQNYLAGLDTLVKCDFGQYGISATSYARMLSEATGVDMTPSDLSTVGERIWNLVRLFNCREGFGRQHDSLPRRFTSEPLPDGPAAGHMLDEESCGKMLDEYYRLRGWDAEGYPLPDTLQRLGLMKGG